MTVPTSYTVMVLVPNQVEGLTGRSYTFIIDSGANSSNLDELLHKDNDFHFLDENE